jgi:hypothetical protein
MSAFGPKRTWSSALHMFGFGGKADMRGREASAHWWLAARDARYSFYPSQDPKLVQPHKCADVKQHRPKATPRHRYIKANQSRKTGDIPRIFETLIPLLLLSSTPIPGSSGECRIKAAQFRRGPSLCGQARFSPTRVAHAGARPATLPFSRTRKLGRGGFTTLRASRVRWRRGAPTRQDRNAGETDGQKKYRVCEAVPRR